MGRKKGKGCRDENYIHLIHDRVQWRALVYTAMSCWVR